MFRYQVSSRCIDPEGLSPSLFTRALYNSVRMEKNSTDPYFPFFSFNSLALAELYITFATVFSRFEFELFETDVSDVEMAHAYLVPYTKWDTNGVRVMVKQT